ncbi:hypothetical protein BDF20DRAFT_989753 [Mycotypha africana]|uniref:uncharacterized protein n=1 Tax=Mycotypha africana TaxID=64632 RepID=UPI002300740D|nr:uncharacterized protein BDF20DRAFT_989753 [Mycotypha africana]KAI8971423.1 hypothetical protein BDF20DRAFT_989753 [Mycotypha africana]
MSGKRKNPSHPSASTHTISSDIQWIFEHKDSLTFKTYAEHFGVLHKQACLDQKLNHRQADESGFKSFWLGTHTQKRNRTRSLARIINNVDNKQLAKDDAEIQLLILGKIISDGNDGIRPDAATISKLQQHDFGFQSRIGRGQHCTPPPPSITMRYATIFCEQVFCVFGSLLKTISVDQRSTLSCCRSEATDKSCTGEPCPSPHPITPECNGMVERLNGNNSQILKEIGQETSRILGMNASVLFSIVIELNFNLLTKIGCCDLQRIKKLFALEKQVLSESSLSLQTKSNFK